ncbi:hypothetical protein B0T18DRAFT_255262 [Schizothecium vesticola]|uniref:Secreted protein n=1 Tax=Schizothecium vesticola TaxID=314040 RepID=A0AA40BR86_9PEZI|nr:hypothetical protein B0T18DRAFT_255262 [Schizothecium vesticola]
MLSWQGLVATAVGLLFRLQGLHQPSDGLGSYLSCLALTNKPGLECMCVDIPLFTLAWPSVSWYRLAIRAPLATPTSHVMSSPPIQSSHSPFAAPVQASQSADDGWERARGFTASKALSSVLK